MGKFCEKYGMQPIGDIQPAQEGKDKKEKKDKKVIIIAGVVAVLVFIGVGVTLYLRSDGYQYKKNMKLAEENFEAEEYKEALFYYKEARKILKRGLKEIEEEESIDILNDKIVEVYLSKADVYLRAREYEHAIVLLKIGQEDIGGRNSLLTDKIIEAYMKQADFCCSEYGNFEKAITLLKEGGAYTSSEQLAECLAQTYRDMSDDYLERGECLLAVQALMDGAEETGNEALTQREEYLRENIVSVKTKYYCNNFFEEKEIIYDESGNEIKYTKFDGNGSVDYWYEKEYDESENEIKNTIYDRDGSVRCWGEYKYDESGNEIKYTSYDGDGSISCWGEKEYDEFGDMIKEIKYNGDGSVDSVREYINKYDKMGRMIKQRYISNGMVVDSSEWSYDILGNCIYDSDLGHHTFEYQYTYIGE